MAARSVQVTFINKTDQSLTRLGYNLSHGEWSSSEGNAETPPATIDAKQENAQWASESDGFMTGTEGVCTYAIASGGSVEVTWDIPFLPAGDNSYSSTTPDGYSCNHTAGDGDNATVTFTLEKT